MPGDLLTLWESDALKSIVRASVERGGGYDVGELVAGRSRAQLHGYGDPRAPAFAPVDVALRLDRHLQHCGLRPMIVPLMASRLGFALVQAPRDGEAVDASAAAVLRESAGLAADYMVAMADGALTEGELAELSVVADRLLDLVSRLRAALDAAAPSRLAEG